MSLKEAKKQLKNAWIPGEGYDYDETFIVCYDDGKCLTTKEADEKLPMRGIIGIQFCGSDAHYVVGYEIFKGKKVEIIE